MNTLLPSAVILKKVNALVGSSCRDYIETDSVYTSMHKGIVKVYFEAKNVEIDYQNKKIKAEIPITPTEYTSVSFECQDLAVFLKSCIKKDKKSLLFYQNVLSYYSELEVA